MSTIRATSSRSPPASPNRSTSRRGLLKIKETPPIVKRGFMQTVAQTEIAPARAIVTVKDGRVVANSRDVASAFEKQHKDVLRAIDNLECSVDFTGRNFAPSEYRDPSGRALRSFDLTRDGFAFLVMGFTGAKAARFKEAYITAFNEMEEELRRIRGGVPADDDDGMEIFGMALRKADIALRSVSVAERLAGPEAAMRLWRHHKLPNLKGDDRRDLIAAPTGDAPGCLSHLLRAVAQKRNTIGDLFDVAFHDPVVARGMKAYGIVVEAPDMPGFVAIAMAHPFLQEVFIETPWVGSWGKALARLPGAVPGKRKIAFDGRYSAAVLIPRDTVLQMRFGRGKPH